MSNENQLTQDGRVPYISSPDVKGNREIITKEHPWMGHPNFVFLKNIESSVRAFYGSQEIELTWAAVRALMLDDEDDFKRIKKKYQQLEKTIKSEIQWAKDNPSVIENPGPVEFTGLDVHEPGDKSKRRNPFVSAAINQIAISAMDGYAENMKPLVEVEIPHKLRYESAALSGLDMKTKFSIQELFQIEGERRKQELQAQEEKKQIT